MWMACIKRVSIFALKWHFYIELQMGGGDRNVLGIIFRTVPWELCCDPSLKLPYLDDLNERLQLLFLLRDEEDCVWIVLKKYFIWISSNMQMSLPSKFNKERLLLVTSCFSNWYSPLLKNLPGENIFPLWVGLPDM